MRRQSLAATIGIVALWWCGCGRERPLSPPANGGQPQPAADSIEVQAATPPKPADDDDRSPAPNGESTPAIASPPAAAELAGEQKSDGTPSSVPPSPPPHERIAVMALGGPLIIDVVPTVDGRAHTAAFDDLVQKALQAADTNSDGRSTWNELSANDEYLADAAPPGSPPLGERQLKALIERFDENRDGTMQLHEAAAWLGRDVGTSVRAFSLRSRRSNRANPRSNSRMWQLLDVDRDAQLATDEITAAPNRFWQYDADDDGAITPAELATLREQLEAADPMTVPANSEATREAAIHLEQTIAVDRLEYLLSDLYSPRQNLGPESFPGVPNLFAQLDADADERLDRVELADLITIEPHIRLTAEFRRDAKHPEDQATLRLDGYAPTFNVLAQSADRVVLTSGPTRLIISAHDLAAGVPSSGRVQADPVAAMVHDQCDAVFEMLDENADGRLGEREIAECPQRLQAADANADGQLSAEELPYAMIVAFLRGERPNETTFFIPATAAVSPTGDGAPAWFLRSDFNGDGDVSRREFIGSIEQFRRLDADDNGFVDAQEASAVVTK